MEVKDFILAKIREKGDYNNLSASFLSRELLDSFEFIELITAIEAKYGIMLDLSEYSLDEVLCAEGLIRIVSKAL